MCWQEWTWHTTCLILAFDGVIAFDSTLGCVFGQDFCFVLIPFFNWCFVIGFLNLLQALAAELYFALLAWGSTVRVQHATRAKWVGLVSLGLMLGVCGASFALVSLGPDASLIAPQYLSVNLPLNPLIEAEQLGSKIRLPMTDSPPSESTTPSSRAKPSQEGHEPLQSQLDPMGSNLAATSSSNTLTSLPELQLNPLELHSGFNIFKSDWSRPNDTANALLSRLEVMDSEAVRFLATNALVRQHLFSKETRLVSVNTNERHQLNQLTAKWVGANKDHFESLQVTRNALGFGAHLQSEPLLASTQVAGATIQSSLFQATDQAKIPDAIANQMVEIFSGDIDFHRALKKGDHFSLVYEAFLADGEVIQTGRILSAQFINRGHTYQAVWFPSAHSPKGGDYYSMDGKNLRRTFLAAPLQYSRISSGFSMRMHPIWKTWKAHLGIDYAAPSGTPVKTVGDGIVEFAGVQNGYGQVIFVQHPQGPLTVYAHLSCIKVRKGQVVSQGDSIGCVGQTGWATGPHLHFEFRLNGQHQDPLMLAKQMDATPVAAELRPQFNRVAYNAQAALAKAQTLETIDID